MHLFQFVVLALGYIANVQCWSNGPPGFCVAEFNDFTQKTSLSLKDAGFIYYGMVRKFTLYPFYTHAKAC